MKNRSCYCWSVIENQHLISLMSDSAEHALELGHIVKELFDFHGGRKTHNPCDAGLIAPRAISPAAGKRVHSVENTIAFFPVGRRLQRRRSADARIQTLRDLFD